MAYQNAEKNAAAIIQGTGLKLGSPISINGSNGSFGEDDLFYTVMAGLDGGSTTDKTRESLLLQRQMYISEQVEVQFLIK